MGYHGAWDTDFIDIPADTPKDKYNQAIEEAARKLDWRDNEQPNIVGFYSMVAPLDDED